MTRIFAFCSWGIIGLALLWVASACGGSEENPFGLKSEVVTAANIPAAMAFAPDGRLFYGEQLTGNIRVITPGGGLQAEPFANVEVVLSSEWGLTGLAFDPDFNNNHYVYAYYTQPVLTGPVIGKPAVVRFTDRDARGVEPKVIVGDLPDTAVHHEGFSANGRIHFGPDGFLYISLGDYDAPSALPQDLGTPVGKLLRVNKEDGSAAAGNPFLDRPGVDPRIFALGFRDNFDFAFHPATGKLYGTDSTPVSCEELNAIEPGANYGWPAGEFPFSDCRAGGQKTGIYFFSKKDTRPEDFLSNVSVSGLAFASGTIYPTLGDSLIVCEAGTGVLRRLVVAGPDLQQVTASDVVAKDCKLDVTVSRDGIIYYSDEKEIRSLTPAPASASP